MLSVTFQGPVAVKPEDLAELLRIVAAPVIVQPIDENAPEKGKRTRTPKAVTAAPEPTSEPKDTEQGASAPESAPAAETASIEKPRRGRPAASKPETAPPSTASSAKSMVPEKPGATGSFDAGDLLNRFSQLIDSSYEDALSVLAEFGVARFSDLKETAYSAFADKLAGLGV